MEATLFELYQESHWILYDDIWQNGALQMSRYLVKHSGHFGHGSVYKTGI